MSKLGSRNSSVVRRQGFVPVLACLAALLGSVSAQAVEIPANPLQSGLAYPPPNVMFIMDDSTSMGLSYMPSTSTSSTCDIEMISRELPGSMSDMTSPNRREISCRAYTANTLYYNPAVTYQPWSNSDGAGAWATTSYTSVYTDEYLAEGSLNLGSGTNAPERARRTFYVPKADVPANAYHIKQNYYRYEFRTGNNGDLVRAEWANSGSANSGGVSAELGCTAPNNTYSWRGCKIVQSANPTRTSVAQERQNFANWYSFHRTRMKAAKAGAGDAFASLGSALRIGFTNIHDRNASRMPIPVNVGTSSGRFEGANRDNWFTYLYNEEPDSNYPYTPLRTGLAAVGEYFKSSSSSGPWGPESGTNQISCRQNFAILTTDGYWNKQDEKHASQAARNAVTSVGNADNTAGPNGYVATPPYADDHSGTLADVAMSYWKNDLRGGPGGLANNVPASVSNPASWQHMVTFGISIGLEGTVNPRSLPTTRGGWPNPDPGSSTGVQAGIDDLLHAAVNSRGTFVAATQPADFTKALTDAFEIIAARQGSGSNVAANSTSFQSDTRVYQARYWSGRWTGDLSAYAASSAGVSTTPSWNASQMIPTTRNIRTRASATSGNGTTFPTNGQRTLLDQSGRAHAPATAAENVAYITGSSAREIRSGGNLRNREIVIRQGESDVLMPTVLGDIVNSSPIYVRETETIFVGANDGMLHAFNALTGAERFAYVPRGINFADLATLSDPQYTHKWFVDGPVTVSTRSQTPGSNYLVGSLGRGGKGVYGLNVTNPGSFGNSSAMWDHTGDSLGGNMGHVLGEPLIVKLNNGVDAVIVSNGVNSGNGSATLFVINLTTGAPISELVTSAGGSNGLFAPRGRDVNGDGRVDYVYAGDLKGNLWRFDLSGATSGSWSVDNSNQPMFTAASGQPITGGLAIGRDPADGKRWVFFGTGKFMEQSDIADNTVQALYGIVDDIDGDPVAISDLVERHIVATGTASNGRPIRGFEASTPLPASAKGWFVNLDTPTAGERVVTRPLLDANALIVASLIPPTDMSCEAGGAGYINALDAFTGTSLGDSYFDLPGSLTDEDGNPIPIGSVDLGVGMPTLPTIIDRLLVVGGSTGNLGESPINPIVGPAKRVSWREILRD